MLEVAHANKIDIEGKLYDLFPSKKDTESDIILSVYRHPIVGEVINRYIHHPEYL